MTSTDIPTTPHRPAEAEKRRALRKMKMIATGAFVLMTLLFILSLPYDTTAIIGPIRWDHLNAFAEAAMIGALADWFAVVALFRHPLGIPIWHTAIIPTRKEEISRNLARFVETRLLSLENLSVEIDRLSAASTAASWLAGDENRAKASSWIADGLGSIIRGFDDEEMRRMIGEVVRRRLEALDAASLIAGGLSMVVESGRHETLIDMGLHRIAEWLPSRRDTVREFVQGAVKRTLKWGSALVPEGMIDRATDRTLEALIQVIVDAAADPAHPLRADVTERVFEWIERLENDPEWREKIDTWKDDTLASPRLAESIERMWDEGKQKLLAELADPDSSTVATIRRAVDRFADRLAADTELRTMLDDRLRSAVTSFLHRHHGEIGGLVKRILDSWDGKRLAEEMELNLGRDLQYIRLNGTVIGGLVGLVIHLLR